MMGYLPTSHPPTYLNSSEKKKRKKKKALKTIIIG
jgi:hypothetical protein